MYVCVFPLNEMKRVVSKGGGRRWLEWGARGGGARGGWGRVASLSVAAVEGVALEIAVHVLHARQLHAILVHAPADATFAATGRFALGCRVTDGEGCTQGLSSHPLLP